MSVISGTVQLRLQGFFCEMTQKMMKQMKSNKGGMKKMMQNMDMNELGKMMK